jgi:signal transduction histidine kinase
MTVLEDLRDQPLLADLPPERLEALAEVAEVRELEEGELLYGGDVPLEHFIMLAEGKLFTQAQLDGKDQPDSGHEHVAPTFLGAIQLLSGGLQTGTARAIAPSRVVLLATEDFFDLLRSEPGVARAIFSRFAPIFSKLEGLRAQRDKLVALGTLAAGLAHELNNPAAAAARGAAELADALRELEDAPRALAAAGVGPEPLARAREALDGAVAAGAGDALSSADLEDELGAWLDDRDVPGAWDAASALVEAGLTLDAVAPVAEGLDGRAAEAVLGWVAAAARARGAAAGLRADAARITALVGAVKDYSRLDRAEEEDVDLNRALDSTLTMLGYRLKKGSVRIAREYDPDLPAVTARGSELNQVFTNLLVNALDAVDGEGTVTVRTRRDGDAAVVEVVDSGPGVPDDKRERIFEPFFTTKPVGIGTGLGLDISFRIVQRHGGSLVLCDQPGPTTFRIRLPFTPAAAPSTP